MKYPLGFNTWDNKEITQITKVLKSGNFVMGKKVKVYYYIASNGREFKIPFMDKEEDYEGIACSIPFKCHSMESNGFINYYDTRYGRRRRNYNDYLEYRMERRYEFEEEEKSIAVANALNKKLTNNAMSKV